MNFVLIHFFAKVVSGYGLLAAYFVFVEIQQEARWNWDSITVKRHITSYRMEHSDKKVKESGAACKGLSLRRSYSSIVDHKQYEKQREVSVKMGREGSMAREGAESFITSTISLESTSPVESVHSTIPEQKPRNFGTVAPGIYRSSYPQEADYPFLEKLGLKTIM